jgi:hypothetical protein
MPAKKSTKKAAKKSAKTAHKKSPKKAKAAARTTKAPAKKTSHARPEKVLVRRLEGNWEEWASWHSGGVTSTGPDTQVGWQVIADHPISAEPWSDRYDRWVKLEWFGHGTPFDLY